jgi:hypothetical protein
MPYSWDEYEGDGSTVIFTVTFPYIKKADVDLTVDGESVDFSWPTTATVEADVAPGNGTVVIVVRTTDRETREVDFTSASLLDEETLDKDSNQIFFLAQEAFDLSIAGIPYDAGEIAYDVDGSRIIGLAPGVDADDAVRIDQISTYLTDAQTAQTAAETAQGLAEDAQGLAETAQGNAETAEGNAEGWESLAEEWAENPEDDAITGHPGQYSALHHSAKAQADLSDKANLVVTPVDGNLLQMDENGDLEDSGIPTDEVRIANHWDAHLIEHIEGTEAWISIGDRMHFQYNGQDTLNWSNQQHRTNDTASATRIMINGTQYAVQTTANNSYTAFNGSESIVALGLTIGVIYEFDLQHRKNDGDAGNAYCRYFKVWMTD